MDTKPDFYGLRASVEYSPTRRAFNFYLHKKADGKFYYAKLPELLEETTGDEIQETFRLSPEEAQILIDELWRVGLRPTEGTGSAGALAATQNHLKDMQKIAFDLLGRLSR